MATSKKAPSSAAGATTPALSVPRAVAEALASLKELANPKYAAEIGPRYGIHTDKALGVSVGSLHGIAKRLKARPARGKPSEDAAQYNHALAQGVWDLEWHEARLLACFIDDASLVTARQMDAWARDFDTWAIVDTACFHLFDKVDPPTRALAFGRVDRWAVRNSKRDEFVKRAAFALLASLALHDKGLADAPFVKRLPLIRAAAGDDRNFVKKGVSWALRSVGMRSPKLHDAALVLALELAEADEPGARWVGKDAVRDLGREVAKRRAARKSK